MTKDRQYNIWSDKANWCTIFEDNTHSTQECMLNGRNKPSYHRVYHILIADEFNEPTSYGG